MRRLMLAFMMVAGFLVVPSVPAQAVGGGVVSVLQCKPGPVRQVDPIVNPGGGQSDHVHQFFGGTGIQPVGTATTVQQMQSSNSTCPLSNDTAGYWVPTLHRADGSVIQPISMNAYYRSPIGKTVRIFPLGFGLVCGTTPRPGCADAANASSWGCNDSERAPTIQAALPCPSHLIAHVFMKPTDSSLPKVSTHTRYSVKTCPGCYIASDHGAAGGSTLHGDFWNTWDQPTLQNIVDTLNAGKSCKRMTDATAGCLL